MLSLAVPSPCAASSSPPGCRHHAGWLAARPRCCESNLYRPSGPFQYRGQLARRGESRLVIGYGQILRTEKYSDSGIVHREVCSRRPGQNTVDSRGRSVSFYTYALEALAHAYRPQPASALVLGLGAGMVPTQLARRGVAVEVVEIDPSSLRVARQFFGFDPAKARVHNVDARTFVQNCPRRFDVVVVDLFHGDGTRITCEA